MADGADDTLSTGGTAGKVVRVGDTIRKAAGPWTSSVHALLRHLELAGFSAAPRAFGVDTKGREILSFIGGDTLSIRPDADGTMIVGPWPARLRSDEALAAVAGLIRELHSAVAGFALDGAIWRHHDQPRKPGEIISHDDLAPWNTVFRDGRPVAFIDWDSAAPVEPLIELADAAWRFVPLANDETCRAIGFAPPVDRGRRLQLFCVAYGLAHPEVIIGAINRALQRRVEMLAAWNLPAADAAVFLRRVAVDLDWFDSIRATLTLALRAEP